MRCSCDVPTHTPKLVALTGGPGAGKTAVLEVIRKNFCDHVVVLPEAASILFRGGFPRRNEPWGRKALQRAIYHVQCQLEQMMLDEGHTALILCDRGTIDGLAYWPDGPAAFWQEFGTSPDEQYARYAAVIHLRSPTLKQGYNHQNPRRIESAQEAAHIDELIHHAWKAHPKYDVVESSENFMQKLQHAVNHIWEQLPPCCQANMSPEIVRK